MRDAVIVSTARTPIGKAYRGAFNATTPQQLSGHAISSAVSRAVAAGRNRQAIPATSGTISIVERMGNSIRPEPP